MKLYYLLMNLLFPPKCILCGKLLEKEEQDLCRDCRVDGPEYPARKEKLQFLDSFTAVWYYEGNVRRSLIRYKFHNAQSYAEGYGRFLAMKLLQSHPEGFDCMTWVPVSPFRKFTRGYDQVELLAKAVGKTRLESFSQVCDALENRVEYFHQRQCCWAWRPGVTWGRLQTPAPVLWVNGIFCSWATTACREEPQRPGR